MVLVNGLRQVGKSTLVRTLTAGRSVEFRNLDLTADRTAAQIDPVGFVDVPELMVIDEIQRVPELMLAIRRR